MTAKASVKNDLQRKRRLLELDALHQDGRDGRDGVGPGPAAKTPVRVAPRRLGSRKRIASGQIDFLLRRVRFWEK